MRRLTALVTAAAIAGTATLAATGASYALGGGTAAPAKVVPANHPDPEVIRVGDTYYMYATNQGQRVPVRTSKSLTGPWSAPRDVMPANAAWSTGKHYWAPEVTQIGPTDFRMYFTANDRATGRQCIGIARAASPLGPFTPQAKPFQCDSREGGAIDASTFRDTDGSLWLIYKNDGNAIRKRTTLWLQRLSPDGMTKVGARRALISNDAPHEHGIIEAPVMVKRGGKYVLFYSGGEFWNGSYFTSYATATSLTGTFTKAYRPLMTNASLNGKVDGPGGQDIVSTPQGDKIVFHGWLDAKRTSRGVYVADLGFPGGNPVVRGSRVRYEAERGRVNHAQVMKGSRYSQGATVGKIDYADSFVEMNVWVPTAGDYTANVAYDAGFGAATHKVSANGVSQGTISYPNTGWGNVREARINVRLKAGQNTIRFARGDRWAQIDHVEIA